MPHGFGQYVYTPEVMAESCETCSVQPGERCWSGVSRRPRPHAGRAKKALEQAS